MKMVQKSEALAMWKLIRSIPDYRIMIDRMEEAVKSESNCRQLREFLALDWDNLTQADLSTLKLGRISFDAAILNDFKTKFGHLILLPLHYKNENPNDWVVETLVNSRWHDASDIRVLNIRDVTFCSTEDSLFPRIVKTFEETISSHPISSSLNDADKRKIKKALRRVNELEKEKYFAAWELAAEWHRI